MTGLQGGRKKHSRSRRKARGFTLIELLVVLVIIGLVATIAVPQVMKYLAGAKTDTARVQVERLGSVLDLYRLDTGAYPSDSDGLAALVERPGDAQRWNGPYIKSAESLTDPWGRKYLYRFPGEHGEYDLYSLGADGREGGEGENRDITSW